MKSIVFLTYLLLTAFAPCAVAFILVPSVCAIRWNLARDWPDGTVAAAPSAPRAPPWRMALPDWVEFPLHLSLPFPAYLIRPR